MFPVLFTLGPVTFYTYGLFLVLSFLTAGYVFWRKGKEEHYEEDELFDAFLLSIIWGSIWSRLAFIVIHLDHFGWDLAKWINFFAFPGVVPLFGLIATAGFLFRYAKERKWNAFEILDFMSLAATASFAISWLGAFFDGNGFGNPTSLPWGVIFPSVFDKRHPTQLYAFILYVLFFIYLSWVEYHYRTFSWYRDKKHSAQTGFLFCMLCIFYGLVSIFLAFFMSPQVVIQDIAWDLPLGLIVFLYGCLLLYTRSGRSFPLVKYFRFKKAPQNS